QFIYCCYAEIKYLNIMTPTTKRRGLLTLYAILFFLGGFTSMAFSQNTTISDTVIDAQTENTLPGVNILVKGTTTGASTDADGNFELDVPSLQDTLVVSYIGYQTQEVPIRGRTEINITLQSQAISGEEMVVIGYGTQKESEVTGSVGTIEMNENIESAPVSVFGSVMMGS